MQQDIVRDLLAQVLAASQREGCFTESMALEIERQIRHKYAGTEVYIKERTADIVETRKESTVRAYLSGAPVEQITRENGISRSTLYRYLKK